MNYSGSELDVVQLSCELINCKSESPSGDEPIDVLISYLKPLGFECFKLKFEDVTNLYARKGNKGRNLCFAGHVDVVPAGKNWSTNPYNATIKDGYLYGRGAVDMKPAIASFISAVSQFDLGNKGSISLLISGNEEADSTHGTPRILASLKERGEKIDDSIVGEPTNPQKLGEMIKIGRRGSINFELTVNGVQGHVAYPALADNPVNKICFIMADLKRLVLDGGNEYFPASNLEITSLKVDNNVSNVIPAIAKASFNIRFNNLHNKDSLIQIVNENAAKYAGNYNLKIPSSFDPFFTPPNYLSSLMIESVQEVTGITPALGTEGGTSDARFIKNYCNVIEFGLTNEMAHKTDERVKISDIHKLKDIYLSFLGKYFPERIEL